MILILSIESWSSKVKSMRIKNSFLKPKHGYNLNHASAMEISLSTAYLFRNATAASVMTTSFSRMTLIASGSILSGLYGPSDSTQTKGLSQWRQRWYTQGRTQEIISNPTQFDRVREFWMSEYFPTHCILPDVMFIHTDFMRSWIDFDYSRWETFLELLSGMEWYWFCDLDMR